MGFMTTVLLVEDRELDVILMRKICQRAGMSDCLRVVLDGALAVDYLAGAGDFSDRDSHPLPELVFLDIDLPKRNGLDVLTWIRSRAGFRLLPVVVCSGCDEPEILNRVCELGITAYLDKYMSFDKFEQSVRAQLEELTATNRKEVAGGG